MLQPSSGDASMKNALLSEIHRDHQSRYDHRLHGVLLVSQGLSCAEVGRLLGDSARSVQHWVRQVERGGVSALQEKPKSGRPARIGRADREKLKVVLQGKPRDCGFVGERWDAKIFLSYLKLRFGRQLGLRQCQRLLRALRNELQAETGLVLEESENIGRSLSS
jgi:transposase